MSVCILCFLSFFSQDKGYDTKLKEILFAEIIPIMNDFRGKLINGSEMFSLTTT